MMDFTFDVFRDLCRRVGTSYCIINVVAKKVEVSSNWLEITTSNLSKEPASLKDLIENIHPYFRDEFAEELSSLALDKNDTHRCTFQFVKQQDPYAWFRLVLWRIGTDEILGILIPLSYVTIFENQDLSGIRVNQYLTSLGLLTGGIAHEFNNLLGGILGHTELSLMRVKKELPADAFLEKALKGIDRATMINQKLMVVSNPDESIVRDFTFRKLVESMEIFLEAIISSLVTKRFEYDDDLPQINADVIKMRQLLLILMNNASESIGRNVGTITVSVKYVGEISKKERNTYYSHTELDRKYICVKTTDTGKGIEPDVLPHIYKPFYSTKGAGRGLGLPTMIAIVAEVNGAIRIQSKPDSGAIVEIILPVVEK